MSVEYLQLIPHNPSYIPPEQDQSIALEALARLLPEAAGIEILIYDSVQFIDQGENWESLCCSLCSSCLAIDWWQNSMDKAYETLFDNLSVTLPCCGRQTSLNDLNYQMPAGFSQFVLSIRDPNLGRNLTDSELEPIEKVLNCKVKQIWSRY
ncbi:hypothetical protein [Leptolyngbya ohadii]|uniref:hypothetical protein n=1 Tax=Leptolyngbya ohadii TaxID=1962290 RepID=UPI000B59CD0B|nr:hypothetical protein [Leptolyngbya ohadii]